MHLLDGDHNDQLNDRIEKALELGTVHLIGNGSLIVGGCWLLWLTGGWNCLEILQQLILGSRFNDILDETANYEQGVERVPDVLRAGQKLKRIKIVIYYYKR